MANPMQLAQRIDHLLRSRLGKGISIDRMVASPLYARDVLLVCDALDDTEAPVLARAYRAAAATLAERKSRAAFDWPEDTLDTIPPLPESADESDLFSDFAHSHPGAVPATSELEELAELAEAGDVDGPPSRRRPWFSPGRWRSSR